MLGEDGGGVVAGEAVVVSGARHLPEVVLTMPSVIYKQYGCFVPVSYKVTPAGASDVPTSRDSLAFTFLAVIVLAVRFPSLSMDHLLFIP